MKKYFIIREHYDEGMIEMIPRNFDAFVWGVLRKGDTVFKKTEVQQKYNEFLEWNTNTSHDKKLEIFNEWMDDYSTTIASI